MIDFSYVPESLQECEQHYVPPIKKSIVCDCFGNVDGMDGSCHWCREMMPYQWHMCCDESFIRGLMSPYSKAHLTDRIEAAKFIEEYKQKQSKLSARKKEETSLVRRGQWLGEADGYADGYPVYDVWYCSECNYCIDDGTDDPECLPNYCPNCGAKMDGEKETNKDGYA